MEIGAIFPQTELSADPGAIREFVQEVEAMGYANLFVADHAHRGMRTRRFSSTSSAIWARAITVSPIRTGARKRMLWLT